MGRHLEFDKERVGQEILLISNDGKMPLATEWEVHRKQHGLPAQKTISKNWGKWADIALELGLHHPSNVWNDEQVIDAMIAISVDDIMPKRREWSENRPQGAPSAEAIRLRFGDWSTLAEVCGLIYQYGNNSTSSCKPTIAASPVRQCKVEFVNEAFFAQTHVPSAGRNYA